MFNVYVTHLDIQKETKTKTKKPALKQDRVLERNQQREQPVARLAAKRRLFCLFFFPTLAIKEPKITWKYPQKLVVLRKKSSSRLSSRYGFYMVHQLYIRLRSLHRNACEPSVVSAAEVYSVKTNNLNPHRNKKSKEGNRNKSRLFCWQCCCVVVKRNRPEASFLHPFSQTHRHNWPNESTQHSFSNMPVRNTAREVSSVVVTIGFMHLHMWAPTRVPRGEGLNYRTCLFLLFFFFLQAVVVKL